MSAAVPSGADSTIPRRATAVWIGLIVATVLTFWLGAEHPFAGASAALAPAIAIAIGMTKATFIGLEFMELRHAPRGLRYAFLAWCLILAVGCLSLRVAG